MKYTIQHSVSYDPRKGILRSENNDGETVQLTKTASALLLTLLNDREVITRDLLLERVWGSQGLIGSYNNLNQYLSILRRTFRQYGLDDIILSIPRMGVQLNPHIEVESTFDEDESEGKGETGDENYHQAVTIDDTNRVNEKYSSLSSENKKPLIKDPPRSYLNYTVFASLLLSISIFMLSYIAYTRDFSTPQFLSALSVTDCHVDALEHVDEQWKAVIADDFIRVRDGLSLRCDKHHHFLFYYDSKIKHAGLGNTLLTQCTPQGNNPNGFCNNYFYYNWR